MGLENINNFIRPLSQLRFIKHIFITNLQGIPPLLKHIFVAQSRKADK